MRKLLFVLLFFIFTTFGIPAIGIMLMSDSKASDNIPVDVYDVSADAILMLYQALDASIIAARASDDADFIYEINQDIINLAIFNAIRGENGDGINPNYNPKDCEDSECLYIINETAVIGENEIHFRVLGVWVTFEEDRFAGNVALEIQYDDGFTYKTSLRLRMSFVDSLDAYTLKFDQLRIGRLPIPRGVFTSIIGMLDNIASDIDLSEAGGDLPLGEFDVKELSYVVEKSELVDSIDQDSEQSQEIIRELLQVFFDYELAKFKFDEELFRFTVKLSTIRNTNFTNIPPGYFSEMHDVDGNYDPNAFDYEQHLKSQFETFIFNMALTGDSAIIIQENTLNKIIYQTFEGFEDMKFEHTYKNSNNEDEVITIGLEALWFEFIVDSSGTEDILYIEIKGLFDIAGIKSLLAIRADQVTDFAGSGFAFDLSEISLGKEINKDGLVITNLTPFKTILKDLDDFPFGYISEEYYLVIDLSMLTDLMDDGTTGGVIEVVDISIIHGGIRIEIAATDPTLQGILDDFTDTINDIFNDPGFVDDMDDWLGVAPTPEAQALYDQVNDIIDIMSSGTPTMEDIEDLLDLYNQLTPAEQESFFGIFDFDSFNADFNDGPQ